MRKYYPKNLEKKYQRFWAKEKIYKFLPKSKKPVFSIDTPPPYASANKLHMGHIMSYTQADFVARFKRQRGFNVFYPMGFDDNGLPTERFVEKKYHLRKDRISRSSFRKLCLKESKKLIKDYEKLWKRIALSVDWDLTYHTINKLSQRISQKSFIDLFKKGKLVRKEEPVIWCPKCGTSLSQADLEDREEVSYLNYIKFRIQGEEENLIVATTRPELLPACVALFFNPEDKRYKHLLGKEARVPLFDRKVPIFASRDVDMNFGTGLMMVCTFGDMDDIRKWKLCKLPTRIIIGEDGKLNKLAEKYEGLSVVEARTKIIEDLRKRGLLIKKEKIVHILNVHERCKTPVEFRISLQWFIKILDLKKKLRDLGKKIKWHPEFMKRKYDDWIDGLKWDWCISRQRFYGVPFPVWYCKDKVILPEEKNLPIDPTKDKPSLKILKKYNCRAKDVVPEKDVMDTWMTSSLTPLINARWKEKDSLMKKIYPMSLRPQGFEIIRTWLFYTMVKSYYHTNNIPWENTMISGWGLDEKGKKMSKSLGNIIEPDKILSRYPVDAVRYWAAGATLGRNLRFQEKEVKKGHRLMTKLWNASRLVVSGLKDYKPKKEQKIYYMDKWILSKLQKTIKEATAYFDDYEYAKARNLIEDFFWHNFCDNYLEIVKYRIYSKEKNKSSAQFALYYTLISILKMFAPFLPYLTEEIYQIFFRKYEKEKSIHLSSWPEYERKFENKKAEFLGDTIFELTSFIRKFKTENGFSVKREVEEIKIEVPKSLEKELKNTLEDLKEINNAKKINFAKIKNGLKVNKNIKIRIRL